MIKLKRVLDAYFWNATDYFTCERNIASMEIVEKPRQFGCCTLTQITTFDGEKVCVTETPKQIFELLKYDK